MGQMYAWAAPEYLLDCMSLEQVFFYYEKGLEFEELRAKLLIATLGDAMDPKNKSASKSTSDQTPDKEAFYEHYGDQIQRPDRGGE